MTLQGTIVVNSVAASTYACLQSHDLFHIAMAPVRMLYKLSPKAVIAAHSAQGRDLKGALGYIDMCSHVAPIFRMVGL